MSETTYLAFGSSGANKVKGSEQHYVNRKAYFESNLKGLTLAKVVGDHAQSTFGTIKDIVALPLTIMIMEAEEAYTADGHKITARIESQRSKFGLDRKWVKARDRAIAEIPEADKATVRKALTEFKDRVKKFPRSKVPRELQGRVSPETIKTVRKLAKDLRKIERQVAPMRIAAVAKAVALVALGVLGLLVWGTYSAPLALFMSVIGAVDVAAVAITKGRGLDGRIVSQLSTGMIVGQIDDVFAKALPTG